MLSRLRRGAFVLTAFLSLAAAACATIWGFDEFSPEEGQAQDGGIDVDASNAVVDAGMCDPDAEFKVKEVPGISNLPWSVRSATLSADESLIYFQGSPDGGPLDIYRAKRTSRNEAFTNIEEEPYLNFNILDEVNPSISANGLKLVFARQKKTSDSTSLDLFVTSRLLTSQNFVSAYALDAANSAAADQNPFLSADAGELWFSSRRPDGGDPHIFRAIASGDIFDRVQPIPSPDVTSTRQETPVISADGKILFYSGWGDGGLDVIDIWEARRETENGTFKVHRRVAELSIKNAFDYPSWISPDGCRLYIHTVTGAKGTILVGDRTPESKPAR